MDDHDPSVDAEPEEPVTITAFGRRFENIEPSFAADLITVEREGAIYTQLWDRETETFGYYRIRLRPAEIVQLVDAHIAKQEFDNAIAECDTPTLEMGLAAVSDKRVAHLARTYQPAKLKDGRVVDIRGCLASFYPRELEALVCFRRIPDRLESLPDLPQGDEFGLLMNIVNAFPVVARGLQRRAHQRSAFVIETEYDVQDLLFACVRASFPNVKREEWTPQHAGSAKRMDIILPRLKAVVETKLVRDSRHATRIADELKIDFESYHAHPECKKLIALVYDPNNYISDPERLSNDLSGLRQKGSHSFNVDVVVR